MAYSKEISQNTCDSGGQPEINMATETGNANYLWSLTTLKYTVYNQLLSVNAVASRM